MAGIADLFASILPQGPTPDDFKSRLPQGVLGADQGMQDRGGMIVLQQMLQQLGMLPSGAPQGAKPIPGLDAFMFNPDPRGEFTPKEALNRDLSRKFFGDQI